MKKYLVFAVFLLFLSAAVFAEEAWYGDYRISGPYTHKNLSIYLVHGNDTVAAGDYMTLEEALDAGVIKINETGNVNTLQLVSKSKKKIFIQSGDIIKGGRQDRVIKNDLIINVNSGTVNINVFCVEHGRWQKRGFEDAAHFSSSKEKIATKGLKLAAKSTESQQDVWTEVAVAQEKLEKNVGAPVRASESSSSLQLTLENKNVEKLSDEYVGAIEDIVAGQRDVVGYVFAINGEINSGDIYGNRTLFEKLWPKQIKASAIEAVSEMDRDGSYGAPQVSDISSWLNSAGSAASEEKQIDGNNVSREQDSKDNMSYESYESSAPSQYLHKAIIKK
jgi:hypothetical protein